jgi:HD superfamily phosphodiesterase
VPQVVKWSKFLAETVADVNLEIILLGGWIHDCGLFIGPDFFKADHAVLGEKRAREILTELKTPDDLMAPVLHIVRSHRNKDVKPETIEAKIVCAADSAAHFTDGTHEAIMLDETLGDIPARAEFDLAKVERDWRDLSQFTILAEKLESKYLKTKKKLEEILKIHALQE